MKDENFDGKKLNGEIVGEHLLISCACRTSRERGSMSAEHMKLFVDLLVSFVFFFFLVE